MTMIWVSLPWATFGIEVHRGRVVKSVPIARWMVGKPWTEIRDWIATEGGEWKRL